MNQDVTQETPATSWRVYKPRLERKDLTWPDISWAKTSKAFFTFTKTSSKDIMVFWRREKPSAIRERIWLQALNSMASVWQRQESLASTLRFTQRKITGIAIFTPPWESGSSSIFTLKLQQELHLWKKSIDHGAHKILHTFGKMETINPTFELRPQEAVTRG